MLRRSLVIAGACCCVIALAVVVRCAAADAPPADASPAEDSATFKNVKVLTSVHTKSEMRTIMKAQAASLGVKCVHCHVPGKFDLDDKKEKVAAREMMKMVQEINTNWLKDVPLEKDEKKPVVSCWTCHRGKTEPENVIPADMMSAGDAMR